jgi:hypothetical protein
MFGSYARPKQLRSDNKLDQIWLSDLRYLGIINMSDLINNK